MELVEDQKEGLGDGSYLEISNWLKRKYDEEDKSDDDYIPEIITGRLIPDSPEISMFEWDHLNSITDDPDMMPFDNDTVIEIAYTALTRNMDQDWGDGELSQLFRNRESYEALKGSMPKCYIVSLWCFPYWREILDEVDPDVKPGSMLWCLYMLLVEIMTENKQSLLLDHVVDDIRSCKSIAGEIIDTMLQKRRF